MPVHPIRIIYEEDFCLYIFPHCDNMPENVIKFICRHRVMGSSQSHLFPFLVLQTVCRLDLCIHRAYRYRYAFVYAHTELRLYSRYVFVYVAHMFYELWCAIVIGCQIDD